MPSHPLYPLTIPGQKGILLLTPCPGTANTDLASAIGDLKTADAKAVLTLMTEQELQQNHVEALPEQCRENDIEWFHLPVDDDEAPSEAFNNVWQNSRSKVHQLLDEGHAVAVHCKGGSGRTGLVVGQILLERGVQLADAIALVQSARPKAFQRAVHREYIERLATSMPE
ncbi:MAG: dual specificity protein phosphatase family protein [Methylophaga sp.]|uniref:phosphatase domain-containing putative toxin n=1 Tax=Methylophaga sp. TaxID=2024840 RepID=UPI00299CDDCC|nr:dual specificity protein phosphatase family protein [Methylophaga sp.]MDX1751204.1 dual specificity protein phosphatase family protein [Methylophaga sp.]